MKKLFLTIFVFCFCVPLWAEDISVEMTVSSNKISLNDAAQLTLSVHGIKDNIDPVELPKIDGIETRYLGPSTKISIVNGQYSSEHAFIYNLFPNKAGRVTIPSLTVVINGKNYVTDPIGLEIVDTLTSTTSPDQQPSPAAQAQASPEQILRDRIFLSVATPKAQVYMGEKVPVSIRLFVSALPLRNVQFPKFDKNGFTMDNFASPGQYSQVVNGVKFDVVEFRTYIYPTRPGDLNFGPVSLEGTLLYKAQERSNDGGLFNSDFFRGMFNSYQERPVTVNSEAMKIKVIDLPLEGQPANFTGAVGQLEFRASIGPSQVKVGDPVTLHMKISGVANYKSLQVPEFNDARFKTYEPQIKDQPDAKSIEQVIIPTTDQATQVPAIAFNYFDPTAGEYKTITQGPFDLKVSALDKSQEFKAVGFSQLPQHAVDAVQIDYVQKYIKEPLLKLIAFCRTLQFWLIVLSIFMVAGGWLAWNKFNERLSTDTAFARRINASKNAKTGIKRAQGYLKSQQPKEFYNAVFKTLNNYLADILHKPSAGLTWDVLKPLLFEQKMPQEQIDRIKELFDRCDTIRFAAGITDPSQMQQDLVKLQAIIAALR